VSSKMPPRTIRLLIVIPLADMRWITRALLALADEQE
jgi:hypothetical protein